MIKGVVFDMDGLMFDTERLSARCWHEAGLRMGYQVPLDLPPRTNGLDAAHSRPIFLETMGEDFDYYGVRSLRLELEREYTEKNKVPVKPGLFELLEYLREKDIPAAVASSSDRPKLDRYLKGSGAMDYLTATVDGSMVANGKPDPEIFLKACALLKLDPKECLGLEDSPAGVRSSTSAGLITVMIPDIIKPTREEERLAAAILPSLLCVPDFIERQGAE